MLPACIEKLVKSSQELLPGIHEAEHKQKNTGACPQGERVVRVHAVLQQLEGCMG